MRSTHTRVIDASPEAVADIAATLGTTADRVWPSPQWWPMRFDGPVEPGAKGGHGPVRYGVESVERNRIRFRFDPGAGIDGYHELRVEPTGDGRTLVTHDMGGRTLGATKVLWPLIVRWCHDEVVEACLDNIERETTGATRERRATAWARLWRRVFYDRPKRLKALPEGARLARETFEKPDYWDSFAIPLRPGMPRDPERWASAIFFHKPFPAFGATAEEALVGDVRPVDFRTSILVEERRLVMSTVVRLRGPGERLYFRGVLTFHRTFVRFMLRRAARKAALAPRGTLVG